MSAPTRAASGAVSTLHPLRSASLSELEPLLRSQRLSLAVRFGELVARGVDRLRDAETLSLAGVYLVRDGAARGFATLTECGGAELLGALWVLDGNEADAVRLLGGLIAESHSAGKVLEAQDLGFGEGDLAPVLKRYASALWPRLWMEASLAATRPARTLPAGVAIRPWRESDLIATADAAFRAFGAAGESVLSASYQSLAGCLARLHAAVEGGAWGPRCRLASLAAVEPTGALAGYALVTRIDARRGHLVETAVRPECSGRGVGRTLLAEAMRAARAEGLESLTLSVTETNGRARALYRRHGFEPLRRFYAYRFGGRQE